ncbi:hypothetical protein E0M27_27890 [Bacillus mycoides]|nr:hypothetical protein E0M27_27890 [Bacillus mycoides]
MYMSYLCPLCEQGQISITKERTGPPGFRTTDYDITSKTCDCITYECEAVAMAIMSYKDETLIKTDTCEECKKEKATIHYPVKSWVGEYKDICPHCFKKEMEKLEEQYS